MAIIRKLQAVKTEQDHLLGIQDLSFSKVTSILDQAKTFIRKSLVCSKVSAIEKSFFSTVNNAFKGYW